MAWFFTKMGFFSAVSKTKGEWQIRARSKKHLENLIKAADLVGQKIQHSLDSDYAYRIRVDADGLHKVVLSIEKSLDYSNVKGMVGRLPGEEKYERLMHRVWSVMSELQPGGAYSSGLKGHFRNDLHETTVGHEAVPAKKQDLPLGESCSGDDESNALEPPASDVARQKRGNGRKRNG